METNIRNPRLSLSDLGITKPEHGAPMGKEGTISMPDDDKVYTAVKNALNDGYAGVIFRGPPGTSKSWYAKEIALSIAGYETGAACFVQFHPSYQYEDFIEGWVPNSTGGFELRPKTFLNLCADAEEHPDKTYVLVIDEISRSDAARVFGEALTYLETSKRGMEFSLASGNIASIPANLVIIGTMNPWDRGVDDVDVALLRRFAQIDMLPDTQILEMLLTKNGVEQRVIDAVIQFFAALQKQANPMLHIGHAYFAHAKDADSLARIWEFQLRHHFRSACRLEPDELKKLEGMWSQMVVPSLRPAPAQENGEVGDVVAQVEPNAEEQPA